MLKTIFSIIFVFILLILQGCFVYGKKEMLSLSTVVKQKQTLNSTLSSVNVSNNQVTIHGSGFSNITTVKIKGMSTDADLSIDSKSDSQIVASATSALSLLVGGTFDLIIGTADAQATYSITFTLQDRSVAPSKLSGTTANSGDVLKYNGTNWEPTPLTSSQTYIGTWDASLQLPNLAATTPATGDYYIVSIAGEYTIPTPDIHFDIGDWIMFNGLNWEKIASGLSTKLSLTGGTLTGDLILDTLIKFKGGSNYVTLKASSSLASDIILTLPINEGIAGQVLTTNGSGVMSWTTISTGTVSSVTATAPIIVDTGATTPAISMAVATSIANGYLASTDWIIFNGKQASITATTTADYYRGDKTFQTLNTSVVPESGATNLYYNNARVLLAPIEAISAVNTALVGGETIQAAFNQTQGQITALGTNTSTNYLVKTAATSDVLSSNITLVGTIAAINASSITITNAPFLLTEVTNKSYVDNSWVSSGQTKTYNNTSSVIGIGTSAPDTTSILDITSTTKGLLIPRMTTVQRNAISTPAIGLQVYDTDIKAVYFHNGTSWQALGISGVGGVQTLPTPGTTGSAPSWSASNTAYTLNIPLASAGGSVTAGLISNAEYAVLAGKIGTATTYAGDMSGTYNTTSVDKIKGTTVSAAASANSQFLVYSGTQYVPVSMSGDASMSTAGVTTIATDAVSSAKILDGTIVNADLNASAAITRTKLANGGVNSVVVNDGSGLMTEVSGATTGTILQGNSVLGPIFSTATYPSTTTINQLLYSSSANTVSGITAQNSSILTSNSSGVPSWAALSGDLFSQYALLAGRSGGQTVAGGTAASNNLTLDSTSHATKGNVLINPTGGYVGIGTTSPAAKLHIDGDVLLDRTRRLYIRNSNNDNTWYLDHTGGNLSIAGGDNDLNLHGTKMTIKSSGNVGIGTTSPNEKLEVTGNARIGQAPATLTTVNGGHTSTVTTITVASTSGYPTSGTLLINSEAMTYSGTTATTFTGVIRGALGTTAVALSNSQSVNNYLSTIQGTSTTPKMVVTGAGFVGIGTAAPAQLLSIIESGSESIRVGSSNGLHRMKIYGGSGGNLLRADYDATEVFGINYNASMDNAGGGMKFEFGTRNSSITDSNYPATLQFSPRGLTSSIINLFLTAPGNVGVGTTAPLGALDVRGKTTTTATAAIGVTTLTVSSTTGFPTSGTIVVDSEAVTYSAISATTFTCTATTVAHAIGASVKNSVGMIVTNTGNVGIGTTSPGSSLDVKGTLRLSGSTSGYVGFVPAAAAGTTTYTLPTTQGTSGQVLSTDGTATTPTLSWVTPATTSTTMTGDIGGTIGANTIGSGKVTSTHILDGTILNADINTSAAIDASKINTSVVSNTEFNYLDGVTSAIQTQLDGKATSTLTSTYLFVGNSSNVATGVALSGDATLANTGALTLNTVSVAKGGTGNTTLTANGILYGNGTSAISSTVAPTSIPYVMLSTDTTKVPVWTTSTTGNYLKAATGSGVSFGPIVSSDLPSGTLSGSGTTNYVPYYSGASTLANSPMAISGSNVGIGTASPTAQLHIANTATEGTVYLNRPPSGATIFNEIVGPTGTVTAGGTVLAVRSSSTMGNGGSVFTAYTNGGTGFRVAETGAVYMGTALSLSGGSAAITLGGSNNTNTFSSGNSGAHAATDFLFKAGYADRTAGNLFQIANYTVPVLTVSASTGGGNVGIGIISPTSALHIQPSSASTVGQKITGAASQSAAFWQIFKSSSALPIAGFYPTEVNGEAVDTAFVLEDLGNASAGAGFKFYMRSSDRTAHIDPPWATSLSFGKASNPWGSIDFTNVGSFTGVPYDFRLATGTGSYIGNGLSSSVISAGNTGSGILVLGADQISGAYNASASHRSLNFLSYGKDTDGSKNTALFTMNSSEASGNLSLFNHTDWKVAGTSIMSLTPSGKLGIGTTSPSEKLHVVGNVLYSGTLNGASDRRLKKDIRPIQDALEKLDEITGVKYFWIDPKLHNEGEQIGVIAQDVEKVFPQAVLTGADGLKSVSYTGLVAPVIQAIKELHNKFKALLVRLMNLEAKDIAKDRAIASVNTKVLQANERAAKLEVENVQLKKDNVAIKAYLCRKDSKAFICKSGNN